MNRAYAWRPVSFGEVPRVLEIVIRAGVALSYQCGENVILVRRLVRVVPPMPLRTLPVRWILRDKTASEYQFAIVSRCNRRRDK